MTDSSKITRRDLIKTLTAAGAALAAAPLLAGATTAAAAVEPAPATAVENNLASPAGTQLASGVDEPLVLVVRDNEIHAFKGMEEYRVTDSALSSKLHSTFQRVAK
jgi:anaerobic selenocysteine-containing dehydrogenase